MQPELLAVKKFSAALRTEHPDHRDAGDDIFDLVETSSMTACGIEEIFVLKP